MNKKILIGAIFLLAIIGFQMQLAYAAASEPAYLVSVTGTRFLPANINAGDIASVAIDIQSNAFAFAISDLNGTIDLGNQFLPIKSQDSFVGLRAGSTKTLIFNFQAKQDTLPGYYPAFLTITYARPDGALAKQTQPFSIPVSKSEKNLDVTVNPRVINPGNQTDIVFTVKNLGGVPVTNLSFSWSEASDLLLPLGSDNKKYVAILGANESTGISYTVAADPNITPGIYPVDVTITFNDSNGTRTITSNVGIIIGGKTDFEISAEISSSNQLSISIANVGSNNAGAVVVKILDQSGIKVSGSSTSIIGNLNKGDYTIANFQLLSSGFGQVTQNSGTEQANQQQFPPGSDANRFGSQARQGSPSSVAIEIDYTDTTGERQSVQKTISLSREVSTGTTAGTGFSGRQGQNSLMSNIAWILLAAFVISPIGLNYKLKKKKWKTIGIALAPIIILFLATILVFNSNLIGIILSAIVSVALLAWLFYKPLQARLFFKKEK
ncbi:MAG: hypothetical protein PHD95_00430 [Candidatus ainarchaeum sp.]|nr:hypothetical protein [Candidatus ainarchaeum sp.]